MKKTELYSCLLKFRQNAEGLLFSGSLPIHLKCDVTINSGLSITARIPGSLSWHLDAHELNKGKNLSKEDIVAISKFTSDIALYWFELMTGLNVPSNWGVSDIQIQINVIYDYPSRRGCGPLQVVATRGNLKESVKASRGSLMKEEYVNESRKRQRK